MSTIKITKDNFETEVLKSDKPVLIDFWAGWCVPCQMLAPTIEEIANEITHAKIGKVDIVTEQELAVKYGVMSIPTLMVFKDGQIVNNITGVIPKSEILEMLNL